MLPGLAWGISSGKNSITRLTTLLPLRSCARTEVFSWLPRRESQSAIMRDVGVRHSRHRTGRDHYQRGHRGHNKVDGCLTYLFSRHSSWHPLFDSKSISSYFCFETCESTILCPQPTCSIASIEALSEFWAYCITVRPAIASFSVRL